MSMTDQLMNMYPELLRVTFPNMNEEEVEEAAKEDVKTFFDGKILELMGEFLYGRPMTDEEVLVHQRMMRVTEYFAQIATMFLMTSGKEAPEITETISEFVGDQGFEDGWKLAQLIRLHHHKHIGIVDVISTNELRKLISSDPRAAAMLLDQMSEEVDSSGPVLRGLGTAVSSGGHVHIERANLPTNIRDLLENLDDQNGTDIGGNTRVQALFVNDDGEIENLDNIPSELRDNKEFMDSIQSILDEIKKGKSDE